ncbi:hypothetical protein HRM2_09190 [Desulforapulum autotrophicum HRM2]|uniref:Uncharacterized protein n=1 Tax=Desulforapulum autotrophicum (strain ATCC 43914 / DSM 3382 / VKM B-1955 / HRM2) TaxID=177437 RepID=C0QKG1_DESAH|nr:hypothetical protein [Desulforapulum autotrophicum]ACN14032.1 hypothetical protein HRM2_09190 [Desulforapulum autotrophicum HRM2]
MKEIDAFLDDWKDNDTRTKQAFIEFRDHILTMEDVTCEFIARPGVSYSLRPRHKNQTGRDLFAMADIIDDDPSNRWLSVCFYEDMITDPDEEGDLIPEGLPGGADGYCFDLDEYDEKAVNYIKERLNDAYRSAKG